MNAQRILAIVDKEWTQSFKTWPAWSAVMGPQAAVTGLMIYILHALNVIYKSHPPDWVLDYFLVIFAVMPVVNASLIAASGIVGDKASRSLEPLLVTPLTPLEFILGKLFAAVLPPFLTAGIAFAIFIREAEKWGITKSHFFENIGGAGCRCAIMAMMMLLASLAALIGFLIASRKTETRGAAMASSTSAEAVIFIPILGVYFGYTHKISGGAWVLDSIGILLLANVLVFLLSLRLFQREAVLFRWK